MRISKTQRKRGVNNEELIVGIDVAKMVRESGQVFPYNMEQICYDNGLYTSLIYSATMMIHRNNHYDSSCFQTDDFYE